MKYNLYLNGKLRGKSDGKPSEEMELAEAKVATFDLLVALSRGDRSTHASIFPNEVNTNVSFLIHHHGGVDAVNLMEVGS